jgi:hypothetical protein
MTEQATWIQGAGREAEKWQGAMAERSWVAIRTPRVRNLHQRRTP